MEDVAESSSTEDNSMEENEGDVQEGTPLQGTTMGDVDSDLPSPSGTLGNLQGPTLGNLQGEPSGSKLPLPSAEEPKVALKKELPPPTLKVKSKVISLKLTDKPEGVIQKTSPAREKLVVEPACADIA
jgi:hypothetical protein